MLIDGDELASGTELAGGICIVGAGPAGLALATALTRAGLRVTLLEAGALGTAASRHPPLDLEFESDAFASPATTLEQGVGGMARAWNTWVASGRLGARYLELDPADFEDRDWLPASGWPFPATALHDWYAAARVLCRADSDDVAGGPAGFAFPPATLATSFDALGPREVFTRELPSLLVHASTARLVTGVRVTRLRLGAPDEGITIEAEAASGTRFTVRPSATVLACGAIETARLLLASAGTPPDGLGEAPDAAGRYYGDHVYVVAGRLQLPPGFDPKVLCAYDLHEVDGTARWGRLRIARERARAERLLGTSARLEPVFTPAYRAARAGARQLAEARRSPRRWRGALRGLAAAAGGARELAATAPRLAARQRRLAPTLEHGWARLPGLERRLAALDLLVQVELSPHPDHRVLLEPGPPGAPPRARLRWDWSAADLASLERAIEVYASALEAATGGHFGRAGAPGRPRLLFDYGAHHHLGTARAHLDPRQGVVDADLRVHGRDQLYVLGSAVFPTGGHANPTLTIVALALRLAGNLASRYAPAAPPAVSVVVATRDRPEALARCLRSLQSLVDADFEVVVVDQGRDARAAEAVRALDDPRFRHVPHQATGLSRARNEGMRVAAADLIAFTDDDCTVDNGWLRRVVEVFAQHPEAGVIFGAFRDAQPAAAGFTPSYVPRRFEVLRHPRQSAHRGAEAGGNMAVRRAAADAVGGFDPELGAGARFRSCEDNDFAERALRAGWGVARDPEAIVDHWGIRSPEDDSAARLQYDYFYGLGAQVVKHARCGDAYAWYRAATLLTRFTVASLVRSVRRRRATSALRAWHVVRGMRDGFHRPIDRERRVYRQGL